MLHYCYEPDDHQAASHLADRLTRELHSDNKVLWLVSGGSNIILSVRILRSLAMDKADSADKLGNLTIMLTDERYGTPGHPDSNWQQLIDAGLEFGVAKNIPTLIPDLTMHDTCQAYEHHLAQAFTDNDVVIAQLGIGGDGHIAGILPGSAAITNKTDKTDEDKSAENTVAVGYDGGDYMRITMTPLAFSHVTAAYCFAYGDSKHSALERLFSKQITLAAHDQPAQLLKTLPEAYVYTDQTI